MTQEPLPLPAPAPEPEPDDPLPWVEWARCWVAVYAGQVENELCPVRLDVARRGLKTWTERMEGRA